jgi:hypothetical protein
MSLVLDVEDRTAPCDSILPAANLSSHSPCPICHTGTVTGIFIEPLCFHDVERAITLKKNEIPSLGIMMYNPQKQNGRKHGRDEDIEIEAESPYLLLSNGNSSISCSGLSKGQQRTGRWTNEESALVDFLVTTFDQGLLPLPHGIKLNEYLGDMLLCKSSRLTKKMKNAKLSTRSFVLGKPSAHIDVREREKLSKLQDEFLSSLTSESTRLVLKLNLIKQWRTHFYNICLQIGYTRVEAKAWNTSLQELEKRAKRAEEIVRRIRRRKMGLSTPFDNGTSFVNPNPMFDLIRADPVKSQPAITDLGPTSTVVTDENKARSISHASIVSNDKSQTTSPIEEEVSSTNYDDERLPTSRQRAFSTDISISSVGYKPGRNRTFSEDFDQLLDVLTEETADENISFKGIPIVAGDKPKAPSTSNFCRPLLDAIVTYVEAHNLPFQHADLWVPSFSSGDARGQPKSLDVDQLKLYHAGHVCRRDVDHDIAHMLHEFGVYSSYFSFEPGKGLPGRVYSTGVVSWECDVHQKDPNDFGRVEGAELYGVKTALAIPVTTAMVGRIVVILYSDQNVPEDSSLIRDVAGELTKYSLEPKWKLVLGSNTPSGINSTIRTTHQPIIPMSDCNMKGSLARETVGGHEPIPAPNKRPKVVKPSEISMVSYNHSSNVSPRSSPYGGLQTTQYPNQNEREHGEDYELASFLQKNMPIVNDSISSGQVSSSVDEKTLRPYFLSFRLLLLRPSNERTARENEIIMILKKSFSSYLRDSRRDGKELAKLIVKDWVCLKSTYAFHISTSHENHPKKSDDASPQIAPLLPLRKESAVLGSHKPIAPPLGIERHRSNSASSSQAERCAETSSQCSSTSSTIIVDHTLYLPRKSSVESTIQSTNLDP